MPDTLVTVGRSTIQHGPNSDRIYLMKLHPADLETLFDLMDDWVEQFGYSKLFAKIPASSLSRFHVRGYQTEGRIPEYYPDGDDAVFVARFLDPKRATPRRKALRRHVLDTARNRQPSRAAHLPATFRCCRLDVENIPQLAALYRRVFDSYPFPIFEESYLNTMFQSGETVYFGVFENDQLQAASSAEIDRDANAAEMTDFATDPAQRGRGFARSLLGQMEKEKDVLGIRTAYTLARAVSTGMNVTFARGGYTFGGTLVNNTQIAGRIESMNIWFKSL